MTMRNLHAGLLSLALLISFLAVWHVLTTSASYTASAIELAPDQIESLENKGMPKADIDAYAKQGLTFPQIDQIAGLGLSREEIDAAGGIQSFGFTTGGAAEEAETGFPSPSQVWREAKEQIFDPFYDPRGPTTRASAFSSQYSLARVLRSPASCWQSPSPCRWVS